MATVLGGPVWAGPPAPEAMAGSPVPVVTADPKVSSAVLAPVEEALRAACGCEPFTVRWSIPAAVAASAGALDSLSAAPEATALRDLALRALRNSPADADRVPVRLRGVRLGRVTEYLVEARPLCGGAMLMTRRAVRAGAVLGDDDIATSEGWFTPSVWRDAAPSAVGKAVQRSLASGSPLRRADLAEPALVRRGAVVRILCQIGGIAIAGQGVARQDGRGGERIGVRLAGASKDCLGVVTGPGEVRVDGDGGGS
jgi:flagella basal body P-ring formation protein FlgA